MKLCEHSFVFWRKTNKVFANVGKVRKFSEHSVFKAESETHFVSIYHVVSEKWLHLKDSLQEEQLYISIIMLISVHVWSPIDCSTDICFPRKVVSD